MVYTYLGSSFVDKLSAIFQEIMNSVFSPILKEILTVFVEFFTNTIWNLLSGFLVLLFAMLCSLIDFLENIFNVFAGMAPVSVKGHSSPMYLIDALFQMEGVSLAFMCITLMSIAICFIFTIYKTAKSISDMVLEDKNPISKVLKNGLKATFTFMLIPFLCVFMLRMSSVVTSQLNNTFSAIQEGETGSVGTILFLSVSMDADTYTTRAKDIQTGEIEILSNHNPSFNDSLRKMYMSGKRDYRDMDTVKADFHVENFNYVAGFACGILLLLIMAGSVLNFIRRLFDVLLLYLISPLYVATIPLDDGATFAKWRDMFVGKFFSGFGSVFTMKLYLMLLPLLTSSNLVLYDKTLPNGSVINNILLLFLIVGGAWAVYKSQGIILEIFSPQAGKTENQASQLITGMIGTGVSLAAAAATGGGSAAAQGASAAAKGASAVGKGASMASNIPSSGNSSGNNDDKNQAYRG